MSMSVLVHFRSTDLGVTLGSGAGQATLTKCMNYLTGADLLPGALSGGSLSARGSDGQYLLSLPAVTDKNVTFTLTLVDDTSIKFEAMYDCSIWDETSSEHVLAGTFGRRMKNIAQDVIWDGTAQAGSTSNTIVLDSGASATDGAYDPACIAIISGTGAGQTRNILQYQGSTRTAIVDRDWRVIPSTDSEFLVLADAGREHVNEGLAQGPGAGNNQIVLNTNASGVDNAYVGQIIVIRSGTGADQARRVASYVGSTKTVTVTRDWATLPDTTSAYVMLPTGSLSYQCIRDAIGMAAANMDTQISGIAVSSADAILKRDWTSVTGEADRSVLNALRVLRNKVTTPGGVLTVTKEDDTTTAWTALLTTNPLAEPITGVDPT